MTADTTHSPAQATDRPPDGTLRITGVTKRFGDTVAVDDVSLDLGAHEILALVGPSGCGKSTLLRLIAGLYDTEAGSITIGGVVVDDGRKRLPPERRRVGLVFQEHALFPHLTVAKNVAFGLRNFDDPAARIDQALDLIGLLGHRNRYPHELSGGERQRVALARALAPRPTIMLLDEPFASLDPNLRAQVRADVEAILRSEAIPAVFVTHDQTEALAVGDRIAVMRDGHIEQLDSPEQVFHQPSNRFVAAFMGETTFLPIERPGAHRPDENSVTLARRTAFELGFINAPAAQIPASAVAMVRPDDVTFVLDPQGTSEVVHAEFRGSQWCYTLRLASGALVKSTREHLQRVEIGSRAYTRMTPGHHPVIITEGNQASSD